MLSVLLLAITWQVHAAESDAIELLQTRSYAELEHTFQSIQNDFKRGVIDDEALLAAFRPFYDVKPPGLIARYDEWIAQFPKSYVAYLARGIHYKYRATQAQDGRFLRDLGDARYEELRRNQKLAAAPGLRKEDRFRTFPGPRRSPAAQLRPRDGRQRRAELAMA